MTLRVDISIVPFGNEDEQKPISRLNVSNVGVIEELPFGNVTCEYEVVYEEYDDMDDEFQRRGDKIRITHNRKHGAARLAQKALKAWNLS